MLKRHILFIFFLVILLPVGVHAQEEIRISNLQVDLWPEYDDPGVLVMFNALVDLPPQTIFPVDIVFRIPAFVGKPSAVATRQVNGSLFDEKYDIQVEGEWTIVTVHASSPEIRLEYYDPRLEKEGIDRYFEFFWVSDYPIDGMSINIQEPVGTRNMGIEPDLGSFSTNPDDSLVYYYMEIGSPNKGDTVTVTVAYQKDNDVLSWAYFQIQSGDLNSADNEGLLNFDLLLLLPWILGGIGLLLVVGGIFWYWRSGQDVSDPKRTSRGRRVASVPKDSFDEGAGVGIYCHQCGKRTASGDRFCRTCGARIRRE